MGRGQRANGEGSVYQRKDGGWDASLSHRDADGKLKRRRTRHATREEADRALTKMKAARDGGVALSGPNPTLREYMISWLQDSVAVSVDPKTLEGYEVACRIHILPALGHIRVRDLRARQIQALYAQKMREGYAAGTRRNIHRTLKRALKQAVAWGEIPSSPADAVDVPKARAAESEDEEIQALTDEQARHLFAAAVDAGDRFRYLYVVAVRTGLRQGELLALRWEDLDLDPDPASITLKRSLAPKTGGGYYYTPTKRKSQRRKLAMLSEAAEALRSQRSLQDEEQESRRVLGERWEEHGLVFPSVAGTPMSARNLYRRNFKPLIHSAGLPDISFHDLRHTFASIMLYEWHAAPKMVQEMLGHASIKMTMDVYGHLLTTSQPDEIRRIQKLLSGRENKSVATTMLPEDVPRRANSG